MFGDMQLSIKNEKLILLRTTGVLVISFVYNTIFNYSFLINTKTHLNLHAQFQFSGS